ncbi:hypothetical protein KI659_15290 [Litoribacter alkaliphilus]|uniref:Outer membrane protein beta-barrel domain-containing protein n=1 Tax=Litoribacter ruber TaxID=702568 RepID=A0AAP2G671_9BACT|nr:hypothetical protein [Litoribacter alkaliphilus]MBS9525383.1 hypothetical protein [Litoribacter alkaliphilus]
MKKYILLSFTLIFIFLSEVNAQQGEGTIMFAGGGDIIRTDVPGVFQRYQAGFEGHYFVRYFLSLSGGYEINSAGPNQVSLGSRVYFVDPFFVRVRGLLGSQSDLALGAGYSHNVGYRFRLEGIVDYYAVTGTAGLRAGFSILLN